MCAEMNSIELNDEGDYEEPKFLGQAGKMLSDDLPINLSGKVTHY